MNAIQAFPKLLAASVLGALMFGPGCVLAHTEVHNTVGEGDAPDNAIVIGHGCEAKEKPVIAQSVLFPTQGPVLTASNGSTVNALSDVVDADTLAGLVTLVQDKSIFSVQDLKTDANGNVIGFYGKSGKLRTNLQGRVPFVLAGPKFKAASCAKSLRVELAVADICVTSTPTIKPAKVNLWIPDNGSTYATQGAAAGIDGIGEPPVLQVLRDLVANPLQGSCGDGFDVTVTPSAADVNANLPMPGWR